MVNGHVFFWSEKVDNLKIVFSESIVFYKVGKYEKHNAGNESQVHT